MGMNMKEMKDITVIKVDIAPTKLDVTPTNADVIIKPTSPTMNINPSNLMSGNQEANKWMGQAATASNIKKKSMSPIIPSMGITRSNSGSPMFSSGMTSRLPNQRITVTGLFGRKMKRK
jgi:hypothetical protein